MTIIKRKYQGYMIYLAPNTHPLGKFPVRILMRTMGMNPEPIFGLEPLAYEAPLVERRLRDLLLKLP